MNTITMLLTLLPLAPGEELEPGGRLIPFGVPIIGTSDNATNVSWLNERPAGEHGSVAVRDGHFVDGTGKRIKFIGGAFAHAANFPTHEMAEGVAARLAMTGFNLVRLHHMDGRYIWLFEEGKPPRIDPAKLERLDYLVAQLKRHGVYANINLKVSRRFRASEGVVDAGKLGRHSKGPDYFDPRMIALQKEFARELLTHVNPYTRTRYADEPAVAFVEINNENSLLGTVLSGKLDPLPPHYSKQLTSKWNAWIRERYASTEQLRAAWGKGSEPLGEDILSNGDFADGGKGWTYTVRDPELGSMRASRDGPDGKPCLHLTALKPGRIAWAFQLHQVHLDLQHDRPYTLSFWTKAKGETTVQCTVRLDHACVKTKRFRVVGLSRRLRVTEQWQHCEYAFRAQDPVKDGNRVGFTFPNVRGEYWVADMQLRPGGSFGLKASEDLAKGNVARPTGPSGAPLRDPRWGEYVRFTAELDRAYAQDMYDYLKQELKVKCPVINTQASYGGIAGVYRESQLDYIDMHAYWDHPRFPRKPWDMKDWLLHNRPMVASETGGIIQRLATHRVAGKPFIVSEFNHGAPNEFAAEGWPIMAASAAAQDWDGVIVHNFVNFGCERWAEPRIGGFFDTAPHPAKTSMVVAAAMMFRRGDVQPATPCARLSVPRDRVVDIAAQLGGGRHAEGLWAAAGLNAGRLMSSRLAVQFVDGAGAPTVHTDQPVPSQVTWQPNAEDGALFTVDAAACKAVVGMVASRKIALGPWSMEFGATTNQFAAAALTALDGKPVDQSGRLLLVAVGRAGNTGMRWRADRLMVADWGQRPALVEAVPAKVRISTRRVLTVYALDGKGDRFVPVDAAVDDGHVSFNIGPERKTIWYELSAGP